VDRLGVAYVPAFLPAGEFQAVCEECRAQRGRLGSETNAVAHGRLVLPLDAAGAPRTYGAFRSPETLRRVVSLVGKPVELGEFPIEYRMYPRGSSMDWHLDEALYAEPQYEVVLTLENTSNSVTEWKDLEGGRGREWTEPNSAVIIRAETAVHRVTAVGRGERSILKLLYTSTDEKLAAFHENWARTGLPAHPDAPRITKGRPPLRPINWGRLGGGGDGALGRGPATRAPGGGGAGGGWAIL